MSGGVPDEEQLRRIERGVQHRIGRRRRIVQRAGGTAAVVGALAIVVGGFSLVVPRMASTSGGGSGGSAAGSSAGLEVVCHGPGTTVDATADPSRLPASALAACARALGPTDLAASPASSGAAPEASGDSGVRGQAAGSPSPSALPEVLCRADGGVLHVYADGTVCSSVGMTRVER